MRGLNKVTWGGDKVRDNGTDTVTYSENDCIFGYGDFAGDC